MLAAHRNAESAERYLTAVRSAIGQAGPSAALKPGHRVPFHWPPHPLSYNYHVLASDWRGSTRIEIHGEEFEVLLAQTPHGVFGRCVLLWAEAKGPTEADMLESLRAAVEPLFERQFTISKCLGLKGRFQGHLKELSTEDLLKLLYCPNRDVASDVQTVLETRPQKPDLLPALLEIIRDESHPNRRSAQWCVLDLFEDMPAYCTNEGDEMEAIEAIKDLIKNAPDDYARTIYKAGVVLGGHLPDLHGGPALIECLTAPSKYGRRSAIHGLFHVVEWHPEVREEVVRSLDRVAKQDPDPQVREFAELMSQDIAGAMVDHIPEPIFEEEA